MVRSAADFQLRSWGQDREAAPELESWPLSPPQVPFFPFLPGSCLENSMSLEYLRLKISTLRALDRG